MYCMMHNSNKPPPFFHFTTATPLYFSIVLFFSLKFGKILHVGAAGSQLPYLMTVYCGLFSSFHVLGFHLCSRLHK